MLKRITTILLRNSPLQEETGFLSQCSHALQLINQHMNSGIDDDEKTVEAVQVYFCLWQVGSKPCRYTTVKRYILWQEILDAIFVPLS